MSSGTPPANTGRKTSSLKIAGAVVWAVFTLVVKPDGLMAGTELPADVHGRIFLSMKTEKTRAYQNERILLRITLYADGLSVRDIQYPQFDREGFVAEELGPPRQSIETIVGKTYNTTEFAASVFPKKTGELTLGPALLRCRILRPPPSGSADAFFGRQEPFDLDVKSERIIVQVLPLPKERIPTDFHNTVGRFDLAVDVHPREVKSGDPVKATMTVKGNGNLRDAPCPSPVLPKGGESSFKLTAPRLIQRSDVLICEQVFIPLSDKADAIPRIRFSFFDPEVGTYSTLQQGPFPLKVVGPALATPPGKKEEANGILGRFLRSPGLYLSMLLLMASISALLGAAYRQRFVIVGFSKEILRRFHRARRVRMALHQAERLLDEPDSEAFYTIVFRALQEFLGDAFELHPTGITEEIIANVLRPKGLDEALLGQITTIFRECDRARYTPSQFSRKERKATLASMSEIAKTLQARNIKGNTRTRLIILSGR